MKLVAAYLWLALAIVVSGEMVFRFIIEPIHRNYQECGTIFLCSGKPPVG